MSRSLADNVKAAFFTVAKNLGLRTEPVTQRVENARMSQTRLKALTKGEADEISSAANPRRSFVGLAAAKSGAEGAISSINSLASMSHYRLSAYASTLQPDRMQSKEPKVEDEIDDSEFIDPKERRARELAAKYC
jgi:hypothetical protein